MTARTITLNDAAQANGSGLKPFVARFGKSTTPNVSDRRHATFGSPALVAAGAVCALLGSTAGTISRELDDVQSPSEPLVLDYRGSFFVGGEKVEQTEVELGSFGPADQVTVNQMYVEYMVPDGATQVPVVMIHAPR